MIFGRKHKAEKEAEEKAALRATVVELIDIAEGGEAPTADWSLVLKPNERLVYGLRNAGLFEPHREPGHWQGRSAGVSVPVADGIRVRIGKSAGTFVQGDETPTLIDRGDVSFTTQRVVFQGGKYTREWDFSKLIGVQHYAGKAWTAIQVSNRQKTSGIVYTGVAPELVRLRLTVAISIFGGDAQQTAQQLRDELATLDTPAAAPSANEQATPHTPPAVSPTPPAPGSPAPPSPPPMWAPDPTGRHQSRYWDGSRWTEYVADNGQEAQDPL